MKQFTKNANQYKLKAQSGLNIPLVGAFIILTLLGFIKMPGSSFKWWMLCIVVVLLISIIRSFVIIDTDRKEISARKGLLGKTVVIPFDNLRGFTIHKIKQYGLITVNVSLLASYINDKGQEKEIALVQHIFAGPIQSAMNEIDEILGNEYKG